MTKKTGYRLMLTDADGGMIDEWSTDDDLDRDTFYEFCSKMETVAEFTRKELLAKLNTYPE